MDNNKRITLSLAIVTIIAVAAIGIGYAYTASTINSGNTATSEYLTLVQNGSGAYMFTTNGHSEVEWNTVDGKNTNGDPVAITNFKLASPIANDDNSTPFGVYSLQQVGEDFTIIATSTNTTVSSQTCSITPSNTGFNTVIGTGTAVYFLKVTVNSATPVTTFFKYDSGAFKQWVSSNDSVSDITTFTITTPNSSVFDTTTVSVYYGYHGTDGIDVTHAAGTPPVGPSTAQTQPLANASLTFAINPVTTSA